MDEYERRANKKRNKKNKNKDGDDSPDDTGKRKKETQVIDFDDE